MWSGRWDVLLEFVRQRTQQEIQQFAVENEIVLAPIYTVDALRRDPQLAAREVLDEGGRPRARGAVRTAPGDPDPLRAWRTRARRRAGAARAAARANGCTRDER